MIVLALAVTSAAAAFLIFRAAPRFTMVTWAIVLFFSPIWVGLSVGVFYSAIAAVTLLCVASASVNGFRWSNADTVVLIFTALVTASFALGDVTFGHWLIMGLDWIVPYIWGRLALARVGLGFITTTLAVVTITAAILAVVEFLSGTNPFVLFPWANSSYSLWSGLRLRGGFVRAEGAFGHSISLGASLSIGSIFVLTARWPLLIRIAGLAVTGAAIVLSFSRIGLVGFALGIVLSVVFLSRVLDSKTRLVVGGTAVIAALAVLPFLSNVFTAAGEEAEGSALYRFDLLSLTSQMAPLGLSPGYVVLPDNAVYIGDFESIDSALILTGLRLGYVPLLLLLGLLIASIVLVLSNRGNAALVALVAQIPGLATVALITQLPYLIWFVAGLGVSLYILDRGNAGEAEIAQGELVLEPERERHG